MSILLLTLAHMLQITPAILVCLGVVAVMIVILAILAPLSILTIRTASATYAQRHVNTAKTKLAALSAL